MIKLFGVILMSIGLTCESALAQISPEIPVRWESVEFTEPGEHIFAIPKNVKMIWVLGCGGGGPGITIKNQRSFVSKYAYPGEGAVVKKDFIWLGSYKELIITIGKGGIKNEGGGSNSTDPIHAEQSEITTIDRNVARTIKFPAGKTGAAVTTKANGGNSLGVGAEPGKDAHENSCAGGGVLPDRGGWIRGNGGSGFVRISWPVHLDRTQKTLERIDELSLRDLMTSDELEALKSEIKEEVLREISTED